MDFVVFELTIVRIAIYISQQALSLSLIVNPRTVVDRAIAVRHFSCAMTFVFNVVAVVYFASFPSEYAFTMLLLVQPHTIIVVSVCVFVGSLLGLTLALSSGLLNWLSHLNCIKKLL